MDQSNEKALFRRGEALFNMNDFDGAKNDFHQVVQLYPANKAAKSQVQWADIAVLQTQEVKASRLFGSNRDLRPLLSIRVNATKSRALF